MSKRNRTAGHNWERICIRKLKHIYPDIVTSRSESRSRDDQKVDLINKNEFKNGPLPVNIQCKTQARTVNYTKLLNQMPDDGYNVILHQFTKKSEKGRFIPKGEYAVIEMDFFMKLLLNWQLHLQESIER